ncbi:MAG: adenylate kinase family enzyme [Flavobacteriales bacterium]
MRADNFLIIGNSGSGKSTLASKLKSLYALTHLDLDSIAWLPESPPRRTPFSHASAEISAFTNLCSSWVIEGCYRDLFDAIKTETAQLIFLDFSAQQCGDHARMRPWEPHKYACKAAQDANLAMLLDWIEGYYQREDVFSLAQHNEFYDSYKGPKQRFKGSPELNDWFAGLP